jgi:hypothetical protein
MDRVIVKRFPINDLIEKIATGMCSMKICTGSGTSP